MDISDSEREFWRGMRALTMNDQGEEVFAGLSPNESEEFLALTRRNEAGEDMNGSSVYIALRDRHEAARQKIANGKVPLD